MSRVSDERALWLASCILPHEAALRAWLSHRRIPDVEIDDVVQETYAVLANLASVEHVHHPRSYMFSVARSIVLQQLRRRRIVAIEAMAEIERLCIFSEEDSPEQQVSHGQELRQMRELIAALPDKCRQAFILRKVHDLPQREVARRMGISENTVEKHIGKAIHLLMSAVGAGEGRADRDARSEHKRGRKRNKT